MKKKPKNKSLQECRLRMGLKFCTLFCKAVLLFYTLQNFNGQKSQKCLNGPLTFEEIN